MIGKLYFSVMSQRFALNRDDAGTFGWRRGNEAYSKGCVKNQEKLSTFDLIWACMSSKRPEKLAVVKTTVNSQIYIDILDPFPIPSIDNALGDEDILFQDDNA